MNKAQIFVGGTGRSGTTIIADILGEHPAIDRIPFEARFHVDADGLCDAYSGKCTPAAFTKLLLDKWWKWGESRPSGSVDGLHSLFNDDLNLFKKAIENYNDAVYNDLDIRQASEDFIAECFDSYGYVEDTPRNAEKMHILSEILPEAKFIHAVRDGRDVADSVIPLHWGPDRMDDALLWWAKSLSRIMRAEARTAEDRRMLVKLDDLAANPVGIFTQILEFCELDYSFGVVVEAGKRINLKSAHMNRWRYGRTTKQQKEITERYYQLVETYKLGEYL